MARFMVKASEYKNVCKAVNDRKLAELKKEIIEILKKQDSKEFKKAIDYLESQEIHYTHLEKSITGKWIEKAGYGIGTVRIWKGKKYKKIAPDKWVRVFDKEGRGTNIAIGKLIAKVQKIDNVEDLMALVMANKQRFVDENGIDLPVLDKLRAAVDARNGNVGSKEKPAEKKELSMKEKVLIATDEGAKKELGRGKMYKKHITEIQKIANSNINDIPENLKTLTDFVKYQDGLSNPDYKQAGIDYARLKNHELARQIWQKVEDGEAEWDDNGYLKLDKNGLLTKPEKKKESDYVQKKREAKEGYWSDEFKERNMNNIKQKIAAMKEEGASDKKIKAFLEETIETNSNDIPWRERAIEEGRIKGNQANDYRDTIQERTVRIENCKELLKEYGSEAEKHQSRSDAMKGNKNAEKDGINEEPVMNDPKSLEGIDFVNKNKMHVLANYLANYDKVNMATAVVRLKAAYEKLGEEKFLAHFPKDVVEKYRKESGKLDAKEEKRIGMQKQLLELNSKKQENNKKLKELNEKMMKLKQERAEDEARGNSVEKYDKDIKDINEEMNKLSDDNYAIDDKGYKIADDLYKLEKEIGSKEPETKKTEKVDFNSMSDDELKDYEAKLEKELLSMDRNSDDYVDKYNHWREVHGENNERFHQRIADESKAEKQRQADAKAEKEKEIKEKYHGYFDSRSGLDKARDLKNLEKKFNFDGKVMTSKDFVEQAIDGGAEIKEREVNKLDYPSRTRWNRMNGYEQEQYERRIKEAGKKTVYTINGFEFPKTVVDYAKYYKENGKKGSGEEKSSLSDVAIKNRASSIASAVAYSKDYQKKIGAPFNMEVAEMSIDDADDMDEPTKKAVKEELKKLYSERKVQKSLDNQFLMDMFVEDEINELLAEKEQGSLFDDYSAEQPGLFNSTSMKVREAFNRCKGL